MLQARSMRQRTSQPNVIEIEHLSKRYGEQLVVDDVCLEVRQGEIFGILGVNGAGKTTTVECAQGLRRPDDGSVRILGLDPIADRAALAGRIGSQLQDSSLPDRLRVIEALMLFADSKADVERALTSWQLEDLRRKPFGVLSGGQRQRLFLALALLNNPEIVFLDELTQGLDPDARRTVWSLVESLRDRGRSVVLVTHFMEEAEALCDRVAVMRDGRVVAQGTPDALVEEFGPGVRVRFSGEQQDLAWARLLPGVDAVEQIGPDIECRGDGALVAHVGHALIERGRGHALRIDQPDLEDALLSLIEPTTSLEVTP